MHTELEKSPARSSLGSGSVKPLALASATTCENVLPAPKLLKMNDKVPLRMPSMLSNSSPVFNKVCRVDMTGKPAPTVACKQAGALGCTVQQVSSYLCQAESVNLYAGNSAPTVVARMQVSKHDPCIQNMNVFERIDMMSFLCRSMQFCFAS